jgi:hypothetical protein
MDQDFTRLASELSELARTTLDTGSGMQAVSSTPVRVAVIGAQDDFLVKARDQLREAGLQPTLFREARALLLWLRDNPVEAVLTTPSGAQELGLTQLALQLQQQRPDLPVVVALGREDPPRVKPTPAVRLAQGHVVPAVLEAVQQQADARLAKRLALLASGVSPGSKKLIDALPQLQIGIQYHPVIDLQNSASVAELGRPLVPAPFRSMDQIWSLASWSGQARSLALRVIESLPRRRLPLVLQMGELHHVLRSARFARAVGRPLLLHVERSCPRVDAQALRGAGVELCATVGQDAGDLAWVERLQPRLLVVPALLCKQARSSASTRALVREICSWASTRSLPVLAERTGGVQDMTLMRALGLRFAAVSTHVGGPLK